MMHSGFFTTSFLFIAEFEKPKNSPVVVYKYEK